jgi:hypothetical protein
MNVGASYSEIMFDSMLGSFHFVTSLARPRKRGDLGYSLQGSKMLGRFNNRNEQLAEWSR